MTNDDLTPAEAGFHTFRAVVEAGRDVVGEGLGARLVLGPGRLGLALGLEAIRMVDQTTFDAVLMDIQMPGIDGLQLLPYRTDQLGALVPKQPNSLAQPTLWRYANLREQVMEAWRDGPDGASSGDERLRLIFTCCHPALTLDARDGHVVLTQPLTASGHHVSASRDGALAAYGTGGRYRNRYGVSRQGFGGARPRAGSPGALARGRAGRLA